MKRRGFLQALAALVAGAGASPMAPPAMAGTAKRITIQESSLAGFQYHAGPHIWERFAVGKPLDLLREPGNPYDRRAVAVFYDEFKIGYVPRSQNTAVSQMMDRGEQVNANISVLQTGDNPWRRVQLEVWLEA
ncbi:MAG: HIRAN domain-containing protein [Gammaproteobacteria bacterium]|nr:MAG: HIRAN domain-containing protein [Gammaproteobacteria bacterium]